MSNPLLTSIILPTYNRAGLIGQTIDSVVNQSNKNWELIVIDDGSTDNTEDIVGKFSSSNIYYHRLPHTGFIGKVRNHGIAQAKGKYVAFLDSDDLWRNDKLEMQISLLTKYPLAKFCFSNATQFGEGAIVPPSTENLIVGNFFNSLLFEKKFPTYMPSLIVEKNVFESLGLLDESFKSCDDIDFFYRLAYKHTGIFTNERLISIRKHPNSNSAAFAVDSYDELVMLFENFFRQQMISAKQFRELRGEIFYKAGLEQFRKGNGKEAIRKFLQYNVLMPLHWKGWVRTIQSSFRIIGL